MVFAQSPTDEHLAYVGLQYDPICHQDETGFSQTYVGDSGSPYWLKVLRHVGSAEQANAIIAVHYGAFGADKLMGFYSDKKEDKCRSAATKVTSAIAKWVMKWHNNVESKKANQS